MLRLLAEIYNTVWALEPTMHARMIEVVERWATGVTLSPAQIEAAIAGGQQRAAARPGTAAGDGAVAVLPVYGILTHRTYAADAAVSTQLTSTERLAQSIRGAIANPDIKALVLDVDSPGGSVFGVQELGDTIYSLRGEKPIIAVANNMAASGGYWIASQADELVVTPSGWVGSIGAMAVHTDNSAKYEAAGVKKTYITAGKYKAEGHDAGPLADESMQHMQGQVNAYYQAFVKAVARGRGVPIDTARGDAFGQGRMVLARGAVEAGMANRMATLDDVVTQLARSRPRAAAGGASASRLPVATATAQLAVLQASAPPALPA